MEETVSYFWDFKSRAHKETTGDITRIVEERLGDWEVVVRRQQKFKSKAGVKSKKREVRMDKN